MSNYAQFIEHYVNSRGMRRKTPFNLFGDLKCTKDRNHDYLSDKVPVQVQQNKSEVKVRAAHPSLSASIC